MRIIGESRSQAERKVAVHTTDFEAAYEKYADMLYRIALSDLGNTHDAEDAVQDTFVAYFSYKGSFETEEHLKAWLIRVLINKARDELRRKKVRSHASFDEIPEIASAEPEDRGVMEEIQKLPEKYKTPIILHYLEDIPVERIAKILGITLSGAKMRLKRGRDMLREKLGDTD